MMVVAFKSTCGEHIRASYFRDEERDTVFCECGKVWKVDRPKITEYEKAVDKHE